MNRILLERSNKESIDIVKDTNMLIKDELNYKYVFNVYNSNLNLLILKENSNDVSYEFNIYGGNVSVNNISYSSLNLSIVVNLNKEYSNITIHNSLISTNNQICDVKINHNSKLTNSYVYNNGVTKMEGSIIFNVSSYAKKGSYKSIINQDSKIINLNKTSNNVINPILLIDEYDTESRHSAFIGNFKDDTLFYLMSRGLSKIDASKLLIDGLLIGTLDIDSREKEKIRKLFIVDRG